jgi:hypothetical protein
MTAIYLYFNAAMYALFALWCTLRLDATSSNLGYSVLSNSGRSEYLTVYGGLQWGLGLVFLYKATRPDLQRVGLVVAICLYAPLVLHRTVSLVRFAPVEPLTRIVAGLEVVMRVVALALWLVGRTRAAL